MKDGCLDCIEKESYERELSLALRERFKRDNPIVDLYALGVSLCVEPAEL